MFSRFDVHWIQTDRQTDKQSIYTRLLGRLAPIFHSNCEHFLFVYIVKRNKKKFADFIKKIVDFQNSIKIQFCWRLFFEILIIHNPSLGSCEAPQKIGPDRFSRFDVYLAQTPRKAKYIFTYRYISTCTLNPL